MPRFPALFPRKTEPDRHVPTANGYHSAGRPGGRVTISNAVSAARLINWNPLWTKAPKETVRRRLSRLVDRELVTMTKRGAMLGRIDEWVRVASSIASWQAPASSSVTPLILERRGYCRPWVPIGVAHALRRLKDLWSPCYLVRARRPCNVRGDAPSTPILSRA
jgi:hypothetical protein